MHLSDERLIGSLWKLALFVQNGKDTDFLFQKVQAALVILERNALPFNVLLLVLVLLLLEDECVELLLKLFVGVVNACETETK